MSSNDLENDIKSEVPAKRMKIEEQETNEESKKLSIILHREIETEIKLRKNDLDTIEENIFLTKRSLLRLKQGAVTDYYKEKNQKEYLQYLPHPAIQDTFLGKSPRNNLQIETPQTDLDEDFYIKKESENVKEEPERISVGISKPQECPKPPCYIPPKPVKIETVKPPEPRGFVSKKHLRIVVGNVSKWLAPKECAGATHKWTVYTKSADPDVDLSDFVSRVVFFLHPSYKPNDVVTVMDPPFKLTRRGWGEFPLKARFHFKNSLDLPVDVMHVLKLDHKHTGLETFGSETTLTVWIHLPNKEEETSSIQESDKEEKTFHEAQTNPSLYSTEYNTSILKEEYSFENFVEDFSLDEKKISKTNLDDLNTSFTKEDIDNFLLNETNLINLSFPGEVLNPEPKNVSLSDCIDSISLNTINEENPNQIKLELPHEEFCNKNSNSSDTQQYDEFLEECNVVESEVIIDCDNDEPETLVKTEEIESCSEEIVDVQGSFEDMIHQTNCNKKTVSNDSSNNLSCKNSEIEDQQNMTSSESPRLGGTHFEIQSPPSYNQSDFKFIGKQNINMNSVSSSTLIKETNLDENSKLNLNNGLLLKTNTVQEYAPDAPLALSKVLIQNSPGAQSKSVNINKNILKGKVISIVKSTDKPINILSSKGFPTKILLSSLNTNNPSVVSIKNIDRSAFKAYSSGGGCSTSSICLPKSEMKLSSVKDLSTNNGAMNSSSLSADDSTLLVNSSTTKPINVEQNKPSPSSILFFDNKKKKKTTSNKEVKSTVITLQKENGQVILRKEAKFKECKETVVPVIAKDKSEVSVRDSKLQSNNPKNHKNIALKEYNLAVALSNSSGSSSPFLMLEKPQPNFNNLSVGGKQVVLVNQKCFKIPTKSPVAQKIVAPAVSLLKKSNQESLMASTKEEEAKDKESVLLKRCPAQNTEIAVSWLMKRFPLVDSRAQLSGFRSKHPYCAKSRDDFLNWPFPKQRAAEWMRAKAVEKILEKLPGIEKWSTLEIWDWARIRAFTPLKKPSGLKELPTLPDSQYFYTQPTEEIIDFINRCKDLKETEIVDVTTDDTHNRTISSPCFSTTVSSRKTGYKFNLTSNKDEIPFEPELKGIRKFINDCQRSVGAMTSPEPLCPGILYPSADRMLISAFYSVAEDIIRRAHNASFIRHSEESPSEISADDVKCAILSRKEFDFLVPSKTEKKERPPVTILPNFS